jgi:tetratricopeptide (TPR) repeat protein
MSDADGQWRDGDEWAEEARRHFEAGRLKEAEAALRQALTRSPDRPEWHFHLGRLLEQAERPDEARESYLRCHELDPDAPEPLLAAAGVGDAERDPEEARQALSLVERAVALDRSRDEAHARRIVLLDVLGRHEDARAAFYEAQEFVERPTFSLIAMADRLEEAGDLPRAAWCYREALRHDAEFSEVRRLYARCLARQGEHPKALQHYMHVLREMPGDTDTLLDCAELLCQLKREGEATEKLHRVIELEPANVRAHHMLGALELRAARWDRAALEFELVLKLEPERTAVRLDLAEAQLRRGRAAEGRSALKAFMEGSGPWRRWQEGAPADEERTAELCARAGGLLMAAGMWDDAANVVSHLARSCPERADAWRALARACFESGDLEGGRHAAERALAIEPRCVISLHNLALAALRKGDLDAAWRHARQGLRIARTDEGLRRIRSRVVIARLRRWLRL